jgi:hypothetical protein
LNLKDIGYDYKELKDADYIIIELKHIGFNATDLKHAEYTAKEVKEIGCPECLMEYKKQQNMPHN